ncbi:hypothetical protein K1719_045826 [Acacia pycnantha]|nr:hypothetical protein K1719_045826 [Acacia pycnantha]
MICLNAVMSLGSWLQKLQRLQRAEHLEELVSIIMQRIGNTTDGERPLIIYEDDEGDKILLETDGDFVALVNYARSIGVKRQSKQLIPRIDFKNDLATAIMSQTYSRGSLLQEVDGEEPEEAK